MILEARDILEHLAKMANQVTQVNLFLSLKLKILILITFIAIITFEFQPILLQLFFLIQVALDRLVKRDQLAILEHRELLADPAKEVEDNLIK